MQSIEQKLSRIDLNLLVSLSTLLRERNVSRAAEVLFLSQPAMSRTLSRLRELFDDPLLYRNGNQLEPTVKALSLIAPLEQLLNSMEHLLTCTEFEPATAEQTFRLAMLPLLGGPISIRLLNLMNTIAPGINLEDHLVSAQPAQQLVDNQCDFTLHIKAPDDPDLLCTRLGTIYGVIYGHVSHPLANVSPQPHFSALTEYPYVDLVIPSNETSGQASVREHPIEEIFKNRNATREIYLRSGQLSTLIEAMPSRNGLLVSSNLLEYVGESANSLCPIFRFPDVGKVQIPLYLIQHRRTWQSAPHQWFSQQIIECIGEFMDNAEQQYMEKIASFTQNQQSSE